MKKKKTLPKKCFYSVISKNTSIDTPNIEGLHLRIFYRVHYGKKFNSAVDCTVIKKLKPNPRASKNWIRVRVKLRTGRYWERVADINTASDEMNICLPRELR